jgi:hypothetical protein
MDHLALAQRAGFYLKHCSGSPHAAGNKSNNETTPGGSATASENENSATWDGPRVDGGPTTEEEIESLQVYIRQTQALLKLLREHYERTDPQILCGFSIGRREANSLLEGNPPGTFLIRFSYQPGFIAVSHVIHTGEVSHMIFDIKQLQNVSLEEWLSLRGNLDYLLDPNSGVRYPRETVLDRGYVNIQDIEQIIRAQQYNHNYRHQHQQQQQNRFVNQLAGATTTGTQNNVGGGGKPGMSDGASRNPSAGSAHAQLDDAHHQASEGEQLPEQGFLHFLPYVGGGGGGHGGGGPSQ